MDNPAVGSVSWVKSAGLDALLALGKTMA